MQKFLLHSASYVPYYPLSWLYPAAHPWHCQKPVFQLGCCCKWQPFETCPELVNNANTAHASTAVNPCGVAVGTTLGRYTGQTTCFSFDPPPLFPPLFMFLNQHWCCPMMHLDVLQPSTLPLLRCLYQCWFCNLYLRVLSRPSQKHHFWSSGNRKDPSAPL